METLENLLSHKSIRKYQKRNIESDVLTEILQAGIRGANTGNMQLYSVIVTQDEDKRQALCKLHFGQKMVADAPVVLTICADVNRFHKWCEQRNAEKSYDNFLWFLTATIDATIVTQNICIAAEEKGLGTCYLGTVNYSVPEIAELLQLPEGVIPIACVTMGYPDENPALTDRLPLEGVVHFEKYNQYSSEKINELYAEKENLEESKNFVKINDVENLAQVFTKKRYTKEISVSISKKLIQFLKDQGFLN